MTSAPRLTQGAVHPLRDLTLRTKQRDPRIRPEEKFTYIDVSSISSESLRIVQTSTLLGSDAPSRARKSVQAGDVLFATVRPSLRRIALVPEELDGAICSTAFTVLRPNPAVLDSNFLYFQAISEQFVAAVSALQRGSSYPAVSDSDVLSQTLTIPPLEEQRRIARILSTIDTATRANRSLLSATRHFKASYTRHFLEGQNHSANVRLGNMDVSIETGPFGSQLHAHEYALQGVRVLNPMHLGENGINPDANPVYISEATADRLSRHRLEEGDVVVPRRGDLSRYALIRGELVGQLCGTGSIKLRFSDSRISSAYFALYFGSEPSQAYLRDEATGTIMPNISPRVLEGLPVVVPPMSEQLQVVAGWNAIDHYERAVQIVLERDQSVFDSCLSSLLGAAA